MADATLYEVHPEIGLRLSGHGLRLKRAATGGTLLVIDDSIYGGVAMRAARQVVADASRTWEVLYAAMYPRPEHLALVDLYGRLCPAPHLFEWNVFNCHDARRFALDMDGILCHDWSGGSEESREYPDFLRNARPRWLPRRTAVPLIVTARLEKHRNLTLDWLRRHGVRVKRLIMGPWQSAAERRRRYDAGAFKGRAYAESGCTLFIESDERQAEAIFREAGKPVLCPSSGKIFQ